MVPKDDGDSIPSYTRTHPPLKRKTLRGPPPTEAVFQTAYKD